MPTTTEPLTHDDVRAASAARAELGAEYDHALAQGLLDRLDDERAARLAGRPPGLAHDAVTVVIALGSIGLGVVFALVAQQLGDVGGTLATVVAWVGIVAVNWAHARSRAVS